MWKPVSNELPKIIQTKYLLNSSTTIKNEHNSIKLIVHFHRTNIGKSSQDNQGIKIWNTCIAENLKTLDSYLIYKAHLQEVYKEDLYLNNNSIYDEYVKESIIFVIRDI